MPSYQEGVDAIRRWSEQHKAITDLASALNEVDSLDQAILERKRSLEAVSADLRQTQQKASAAQTELEALHADHAKSIAEHGAATKGVIEGARATAEQIVQAAKRDADELRAVAVRDAEATRAAHVASMQGAAGELDNLKAQIAEAHALLASLQDQHAAVNEKMAAVKQAAKSLLTD